MRVAIVNDLKLTVEFLRQIIEKSKRHKVAWLAYNGKDAVDLCAKDTPDIILMDLVMPVVDGVHATQLIMKNSPCAILIVTASVGSNAPKVFEAMGYGALDVVKTPSLISEDGDEIGAELLRKIDIIALYLGKQQRVKDITRPLSALKHDKIPQLLVIGASTGGPAALAKVLSSIRRDTRLAVIIIQHVDEQFAEGLAGWLAKQTFLPVAIAEEGCTPQPGHIYLAGKDKHLIMTSSMSLHYQEEPLDIPYRPSVDVFFQSIAETWPEASVAVLLTGMGSDGAQGLKLLHDKGWHTIAQDQHSCVVFGMPKAAIEIGAVTEVLTPEEIGEMCHRGIDKTIRKRRP